MSYKKYDKKSTPGGGCRDECCNGVSHCGMKLVVNKKLKRIYTPRLSVRDQSVDLVLFNIL